MLNQLPITMINHTPISQWHIRPAISFWASAYSAGIRILWDGAQFLYRNAVNWNRRIENAGAFGIFPADAAVNPAPWITDGVEEHDTGLIQFLSQPFPSAYKRFAAHVLVLDYEVKPIEAHARRNGHIVTGIGLNGGYTLMYQGKCEPSKREYGYDLPAVLRGITEVKI